MHAEDCGQAMGAFSTCGDCSEILLDGNTAVAAYKFSSVTGAGNLYSSLNDSFQILVTIPYVRLNEANKQNLK